MDKAQVQKSLPHKHGVVAVLQDGQGRYLVIRRGATLARAPGWWCFVGGEVDPGEKYEAAIEREVREEVGLNVVAREKVHETIAPNGEFLLHWMRVELAPGECAICLHPIEVAEARWLTAAEALKLEPILPGLKAWLEGQV
jgi:8-oxo-dGTP diphosphatase